jgi:biotin carboxylase
VHTEQRPLILMLGADRYALEACVRHDIDAVVICGPAMFDDGIVKVPEPLTLLQADDHCSVEAVLMALHRAGFGGRHFDGVQTTSEPALVTASLLARYLGCDFIDPSVAVLFRDKSLQKAQVAKAGLRTADVIVIDDVYDVSGIGELPYRKAVLKPVGGAATALTSVVSSIEELRERSREYCGQRITQRTFVLEEHIRGDEWLADGIMFEGELLFCSLARYCAPCLSLVEDGLPLSTSRFDPERDDWAYERALPVIRPALEALGLRSGVFHMELFHDDATGGLVFGECAARRGGVLVHEELRVKFNVNLAESAVLCALGRRPELEVKLDPRSVGGAHLLGSPGILIECPTPAQVATRPGVVFARIERPYGTVIAGGLASTNQRIGQFLVAADSDEELARRFQEVRAWFAERTKTIPSSARTPELRAWQRRTWPDADFSDTLWN